MRKIFRNNDGHLRNGWWILIFAVLFVLSRIAYTPLSKALQQAGFDGAWLAPLPVLMLLLVTFVCQRLRRERLADVGLRVDLRWLRQALAGVGLGCALMALVTALIVASGGVRLGLDPQRSVAALAAGAWTFLAVAWLEELLFRGFVFQRLVAGLGTWPAQALLAVLFAVAHWNNPGMEGATRLWASLDIGLGALLLGLAFLRTRSLALPIGIHFGWNWLQGSVLGFGVSGVDGSGWLLPQFTGRPQWLTGGEFGPEASVVAVVVDLVAVVLLWRWKGWAPAQLASTAVPAASAASATSGVAGTH